jgi:hypothetical protein
MQTPHLADTEPRVFTLLVDPEPGQDIGGQLLVNITDRNIEGHRSEHHVRDQETQEQKKNAWKGPQKKHQQIKTRGFMDEVSSGKDYKKRETG